MNETDIRELRKPFAPNMHLSNYDGFIYVDETAVSERLDEIDPDWQFQIVSISNRDRKVTVHARMVVLGVVRDGIGMTTVEYVKEKDDKGKVIGETSIEISEPEKAAATDALRRCARLFGIGRYLLGAPKAKGAKEWQVGGTWSAFNQWYQDQFGAAPTVSTNGGKFEWTKTEIANLLADAEVQGWSKEQVKVAAGLKKGWDELSKFPTYEAAWTAISEALANPVEDVEF